MKITCCDLFAGAGGTSTGLVRACHGLGYDVDLTAVNHWKTAIATHTRNHPWATHLCADLNSLDPNKVISGGKLDLLVASPECTHHSVARGGKPCSDQSRAGAWHVLHWLERLRVENVLIENVKEFINWGPLDAHDRPIKEQKGSTFNAFLAAIQSLGFNVEYRVLNAADYGDATTRMRVFVQACRGRKPTWPLKSHEGHWRPAKDIIDWSLPGQSIFNRKKPLTRNTLRRIESGLMKFGGEVFLTIMRGTSNDQKGSWAKSVDSPLPTVTAGGIHVGLCQLFIIPMEHSGRGALRKVDAPLPTITTAKGGAFGLCMPFVLGQQSGSAPRSVEDPIPTVAGAGALSLVESFVVSFHGGKGGDRRTYSAEDPLPTVDTSNRFGLVQPFLMKYYGKGTGATAVTDPVATITTKERHALVQPVIEYDGRKYYIDIRFRMLQPHELAAAMGFSDYVFEGTKTEIIKQIGNAVPVNTAEALCRNLLQ